MNLYAWTSAGVSAGLRTAPYQVTGLLTCLIPPFISCLATYHLRPSTATHLHRINARITTAILPQAPLDVTVCRMTNLAAVLHGTAISANPAHPSREPGPSNAVTLCCVPFSHLALAGAACCSPAFVTFLHHAGGLTAPAPPGAFNLRYGRRCVRTTCWRLHLTHTYCARFVGDAALYCHRLLPRITRLLLHCLARRDKKVGRRRSPF